MAESLYGFDDPLLPFDDIIEKVKWVPEYIDGLTVERNSNFNAYAIFAALINIVLVFAGARTSALLDCHIVAANVPLYKRLLHFVKELNSVVTSIPNGKRHLLSIYRYDRMKWFIARRSNPRFIWKRKLTHRETGLNLDYAAPGHLIGQLTTTGRGHSVFAEVGANPGLQIFAEFVLLQFMEYSMVEEFSLKRETLMNIAMQKLNFPYRFRWFWTVDDDVARTMNSAKPPSKAWWDRSWYHINHISGATLIRGMRFCSDLTPFEEHWEVIQRLYRHKSVYENKLDDSKLACRSTTIVIYRKIKEALEAGEMERVQKKLDEFNNVVSSSVITGKWWVPNELRTENLIIHHLYRQWSLFEARKPRRTVSHIIPYKAIGDENLPFAQPSWIPKGHFKYSIATKI